MVKKNQNLIIIILLIVVFSIGVLLAIMIPKTMENKQIDKTTQSDNKIENSDTTIPGLADRVRNSKLSLEIASQKSTYSVGDIVSVDLTMDSGRFFVVGMDAIIKYPSDFVKVLSIEPTQVFDAYPLKTFENGKILVSGIKEPKAYTSGYQKVAVINFEFIKAGQSIFKFDFTPMATIDSNIIESGSAQDILGSTNELSFTVK